MREFLRRQLPIAVVVCVVTTLFPSALQAQQEGLRDRERNFSAAEKIANDLQSARFHKGPFYFLSIVELSDIGYNQQFFLPTTDQSTGLSVTVDAPQRLYFVPHKKTIYSLELTPSYSLGTGARGKDRLGWRGRADAQYLLNHLYLDFYTLSSDRLSANSGELNRIFTVREHNFGVNGEVKYSSRTSASFSAGYFDYAHPPSRLQPDPTKDVDITQYDRTEHDYRLSILHKTFPLTSLFLSGELANYKFSNATREDSRRSFAGGGFTHDNGRMLVRAEGGLGRLEFRNPAQKDFRGFLGNIDAVERASYHWTLTTRLSRDADFSLRQPGNSYYILDRGQFTAEYSATRRLTLRALVEGGWDRYDVPSFRSRDNILLRRKDSIGFFALGWLYSARRFRGGFDLGYYDRNSNFSIDEQHGIRLVVHLSYIL